MKKNQASDYIVRAWLSGPDDVKMAIQTDFNCCGLRAYNESAPQPCPTAATQPCLPILVDAFNTAYAHAGGTGIAFSIIMGLAIILVVMLIRGIKIKSREQLEAKVREANRDGRITDMDAGAASMFDREGYHNDVKE